MCVNALGCESAYRNNANALGCDSAYRNDANALGCDSAHRNETIYDMIRYDSMILLIVYRGYELYPGIQS